MSAAREGNATLDFAEAVLALWPEFAANEAHVLVRLKRQFESNTKIVSCSNNIWNIESENDKTETDLSEWIRVGDSSFFLQTTTSEELATKIQQHLDNLNVQPGSDVRPDNKVTPLE
jgi:hypothetical protein